MPKPPPQPLVDRDDDDDLPPPPKATGDAKLQRWVDLLAALLVRRHQAPFEELARDVPAYAKALDAAAEERDPRARATKQESLKRTFERDKDELRTFGILIESVADEQGNAAGAYLLKKADFYLPYLSLAVPGRAPTKPKRVDEYGYKTLATLAFEADELRAVVDAAACVRALGDPLLAADAAIALRKLAVDLPVDAGAGAAEPHVVLPRTRPDIATFEALGDALGRRKVVTFGYRAMSTDRAETREVEPYGLFFLHGHWYLVARDRARAALRNFRLDRITGAKVATQRAQSADYEIPATFRLRDHAASRHAWELGDAESVRAVVQLRGESGPVTAALRLGSAVEGEPMQRAFAVRRADAFVRWMLSFAGEVVPIEPAALVAQFRAELQRTAAVYEAGVSSGGDAIVPSPLVRAASTRAPAEWQPKGAAAQLRRILQVMPQIADGDEHRLADVAERVGTDVETLRRDLYSLVSRYDTPAGFIEGVRLYMESDRVSASSNHLLRPMRLTVSELCALELGLAALRGQRTPDEHGTLDRARARLRTVIARLPADPIPDGMLDASVGEQGGTAQLAAVREALAEGRELRIMYRKSSAPADAEQDGSASDERDAEPRERIASPRERVAGSRERVICPRALVASSGMLYLVAYREGAEGLRVFRMDRVEDAEVRAEKVAPAPSFSLETVVREGRVFHRPDAGVMLVRYSARVSRWIAEREGRQAGVDGTLVMEHPLADGEWGLRHVLQYGPDAEVLAPVSLREALAARLAAMQDAEGAVA